MLLRILSKVIRFRRKPDSRAELRKAFERYAAGDYSGARLLCETLLERYPQFAEAYYLLGLIACRDGNADQGVNFIENALERAPDNIPYLAALGDARLLQQKEEEALVLYSRAFPTHAACLRDFSDDGLAWKKVHPDWFARLRRVTMPDLNVAQQPDGEAGLLSQTSSVPAGHFLNWALLLVLRRRVRAAIYLLEEIVKSAPRQGYAHAVLALLLTLNQDAQPALEAARTARSLGDEAFAGSNDLCIIAAQLQLGCEACELDPIFDWSTFCADGLTHSCCLDHLPPLEGLPFPQFPTDVPVYLVCCDTNYFLEHAIPLILSISDNCRQCAIHVHLFNPEPAAWNALRRVQSAIALQVSATWELVDFERYGGKGSYCTCARFVRLYQLLLATENRIVMFDADSLVRGDPAPDLERCRDIGLVDAPNEPVWHRYLAGVTTFRRSRAAERFLAELAAFLTANLAVGRTRLYMDQIALYVCAMRCRDMGGDNISHLPISRFCDTLFHDDALIWSITQHKNDDNPFTQYKRDVLRRHQDMLG